MVKMWNLLLGVILMFSTSWGYVIKQDNLLMYFESVEVFVYSKTAGETANNQLYVYNSSNTFINYDVGAPDAQKLDITLNFHHNNSATKDPSLIITLRLEETPRQYIYMSNVNVTMKESPRFPTESLKFISQIPLESPKDRSFHCSRFGRLYPDFDSNGKLTNETMSVEFFGLQVQAFNGNGTINEFTESYDCVGYFTPGILSGIFIATILIAVITWGLAMIMDVKTMDKFDDPKGKPISFGGVE